MIQKTLTIINYHKIEFDSDIGLTTRHPDHFKDDLDSLCGSGYTTITFDELNANKNLPQKPIIITFDDAYLSFYEKAIKFLKERNMKAVVFVPVDYIGKINNWDVQLFKKKYWHMNEEQLSDISEQGMEVGSHALSHRLLNHMSKKNIKHELRKSKKVLEEIINKEVISISYPFGRTNFKVLKQAKEHYKFGVQLLHSNSYNKQFENLSLNRVNIYRTDSRKTFQKKLDLNKHPLLKLKSQLIQSGAWATVLMQKIVIHKN